LSSDELRRTMGRFCSGVTIIAALVDGKPVGMTCQAFLSLSLDPPLVAFAPSRASTTYPRIRTSDFASISILAHTQSALALRFADTTADKWSETAWTPGITGSPLIDGAVASLECAIEVEHEAGDHHLVIARVLSLIEGDDAHPLLFYRSRFPRLS
jgi:flavin reductase (DIM6/NTAB) family NADH-FMN oxidoreductase RutF